MARRDSENRETQVKSARTRHPRRSLMADVIPPSVLREVTGGEGEDYIRKGPPSPPPPEQG
jgi:hypothetical protein